VLLLAVSDGVQGRSVSSLPQHPFHVRKPQFLSFLLLSNHHQQSEHHAGGSSPPDIQQLLLDPGLPPGLGGHLLKAPRGNPTTHASYPLLSCRPRDVSRTLKSSTLSMYLCSSSSVSLAHTAQTGPHARRTRLGQLTCNPTSYRSSR
jgi:hypothetical protein